MHSLIEPSGGGGASRIPQTPMWHRHPVTPRCQEPLSISPFLSLEHRGPGPCEVVARVGKGNGWFLPLSG